MRSASTWTTMIMRLESENKILNLFYFKVYHSKKPDDVAANIGSLIIPTSQNEYEFGDGDDEEEAVDVTLKADDHVLLAGNDCPDGTANVEVRVYFWFFIRNFWQFDNSFFVHTGNEPINRTMYIRDRTFALWIFLQRPCIFAWPFRTRSCIDQRTL